MTILKNNKAQTVVWAETLEPGDITDNTNNLIIIMMILTVINGFLSEF